MTAANSVSLLDGFENQAQLPTSSKIAAADPTNKPKRLLAIERLVEPMEDAGGARENCNLILYDVGGSGVQRRKKQVAIPVLHPQANFVLAHHVPNVVRTRNVRASSSSSAMIAKRQPIPSSFGTKP